MVVDSQKFQEIADQVIERLAEANADGTLATFLMPFGLQSMLDDGDFDYGVNDPAYGDILVLGGLQAKKNALYAIAEEYGVSKNRIQIVEYEDVTNFGMDSIRGSTRYAAVMCGPTPHKAAEIGDESSMLEALRKEGGNIPPLEELREAGGGKLRITNTSFRTGLQKLIDRKAVRPDML